MPDYQALTDQHLLGVYRRLPGVFVRGKGCEIWDEEGNRHLDFLAGIAVNSLGHCHPAVTEAICRQAAALVHTSNFLVTPTSALLAERLTRITGLDKVFLTNDGTTAVEAAFKLARKYGNSRGKTEILSLTSSFHGRSMGALSATAQPKYQDPFRPLLPNFRAIPANDADALRGAIGPETCALIIEPIQGEGGVKPLDFDYVRLARELTKEHGTLLIGDEIQTGIGRTGKWLGLEHSGVTPDLICLAKGLAGGFPIGALVVSEELKDVLAPGEHGSTFGGSPLAAAAALAVLDTIEHESVMDNVRARGEQLHDIALQLPLVESVRGLGLMRGLRLSRPVARETVQEAMKRGLITNATDESTLRIVPPLIISSQEMQEGLSILGEALASAV